MKYESREPDLTCRWRSDGHFPSVCPARGWTTLKNLKEAAGGSYSSFEQFCQVGRASLDIEQIRAKWRYRAWSHPWPVSSLFSFLLASFLWQSAGNRPRWQSHWRASQLPGHRKSWSLWAISLQFAASLRPHVIKLSLWERVKKEKTTCDLTCWFPENRTLQGAEGKGTEAGGGTEVCNKDLSFSFQEVFKLAAPWGHHWNFFFFLKGPWSQPLYGSLWSLSPLGFFLESSGTMYQVRIKALQSCFQKELILRDIINCLTPTIFINLKTRGEKEKHWIFGIQEFILCKFQRTLCTEKFYNSNKFFFQENHFRGFWAVLACMCFK